MTGIASKQLVATLEKAYKQAAIEYANQELEVISVLAKKNLPPLAIYSGNKSNLLPLALCFIPLIAFGTYSLLNGQLLLSITCLILSILNAFQLIKLFQYTKTPLFTISEQGIQLPIFKKTIPWESIDNFYISQTYKLIFNFHLNTDFSSKRIKKNMPHISFNPVNNEIQIVMLLYKNKNNSLYYQNLLTNYWNVGIAKVRLKELTKHS